MKLQARPDTRVIHLGSTLVAAGTLGFFQDPYWFERIRIPLFYPTFNRRRFHIKRSHVHLGGRWFRPLFTDATFVTKSLVTDGAEGNMKLQDAKRNFEPWEWKPACIHVGLKALWRGYALNAVGLSSPPAKVILDIGIKEGRWRKTKTISSIYSGNGTSSEAIYKPFIISFSPHKGSKAERVNEWQRFVKLLLSYMEDSGTRHWLMSSLVVQINLSCPNSAMNLADVQAEAQEYLNIGAELGVPLQIKVNLLVSTKVLVELGRHPVLSGLCLSNTAPFGDVMPKEWWKKHFPGGSPLAKFRGGGLSGRPLFPYVLARVRELHKEGFEKPLNVGGGILEPSQVGQLVEAGLRPGVDSIMLGSIAFLRPWNIPSVTRYARELLDEQVKKPALQQAA